MELEDYCYGHERITSERFRKKISSLGKGDDDKVYIVGKFNKTIGYYIPVNIQNNDFDHFLLSRSLSEIIKTFKKYESILDVLKDKNVIPEYKYYKEKQKKSNNFKSEDSHEENSYKEDIFEQNIEEIEELLPTEKSATFLDFKLEEHFNYQIFELSKLLDKLTKEAHTILHYSKNIKKIEDYKELGLETDSIEEDVKKGENYFKEFFEYIYIFAYKWGSVKMMSELKIFFRKKYMKKQESN